MNDKISYLDFCYWQLQSAVTGLRVFFLATSCFYCSSNRSAQQHFRQTMERTYQGQNSSHCSSSFKSRMLCTGLHSKVNKKGTQHQAHEQPTFWAMHIYQMFSCDRRYLQELRYQHFQLAGIAQTTHTATLQTPDHRAGSFMANW